MNFLKQAGDKIKTAGKNAGEAIAPGIHVRNETDVPLLFVLSQLSPLHWCRVEPGETQHVKCGRVWFTVSTEVYDESTEPTAAGVALRITAITAATVLTGGLLGIAVVGGVSAVTSYKPCKAEGVFADGKTVVIKIVETDDGISKLQIHSFERKN
jgi:hypothetical protein